jgi:hypothetical protein
MWRLCPIHFISIAWHLDAAQPLLGAVGNAESEAVPQKVAHHLHLSSKILKRCICRILGFFFLVVLEFEFMTLHLLDRHSTT